MNLPIKINPVEKKLLLGGLVTSLAYWGNRAMREYYPQYPAELKGQLEPHLPPNGDIISCVAPPLGLYAVKKFTKSEKAADLAFGATLYGFPQVLRKTIATAAWVEGEKAKPAARIATPMAQARYTTSVPQTTRVAVTPTVGKYRLTA